MTYSILAHDTDTGALGIAVQSKFPGVSTLICHGAAGVGVIATQAFSNPDHGTRGLELLRLGVSPATALQILLDGDENRGERQLAILAPEGSARFTGEEVRGWAGFAGALEGNSCLAHGNGLAGPHVLQAMVDGFAKTDGDFATRLIAALSSGEAAGGELRGVQSAGLQVFQAGAGYGGRQEKLVDISIYDHADPIGELSRCYGLHRLSYFPSADENLVPIDAETAAYLTRILVDEGYLEGTPRPDWDADKIAAFARFMGTENYDNRIRDDALIDLEVLADIRARRSN
ncbi:DUF1028 domain-containing protein [Rhodobium gokarnense]|uniref:Ntn-hydrolase superfamily protein n=1 Tax=Rhodobium gokarnense TaxID=364296 RepID=A0ABT3H8P1_9HYPH|nr:DUF1028 domain-containing protein [Rhodobium gokarnense]MCW2306753.1 putative Ntn-hydrolase superfamily protein [Rhodobium gokarnense]